MRGAGERGRTDRDEEEIGDGVGGGGGRCWGGGYHRMAG